MDTAFIQWLLPVIQWLLGKLDMLIGLFTAAEWKAMSFVTLSALCGTHVIKKLWRASPMPGGSDRQVEAIAVLVAFAVAFVVWPSDSAPWWIAAMIGAGAAMLIFKVGIAVLEAKLPKVARVVKMDRRRVWGIPPKNRLSRRKDDSQ